MEKIICIACGKEILDPRQRNFTLSYRQYGKLIPQPACISSDCQYIALKYIRIKNALEKI